MLHPFKNIKVLDLTEGVAGPYAAMILADLGADVVKIERPDGDWGRILGKVKNDFSSQYIALNRNKKNICLNIKTNEGQDVLKKMAKQSDIIITSFRPGVMEKNNLGYEDIKKVNSNIIYGRITGYGYLGKHRHYTGVDTVIQANSGIMNHIGPSDGKPYRTGFPIVDHVAARDLVQGIQALYIQRLKGKTIDGPIDVSLYSTAAALQTQQWQGYFLDKDIPKRTGNLNPVIAPSGVYETKDNLHISIAIVRNQQWKRLCKALKLKNIEDSSDFETNEMRLNNRDSLEKILVERFKTKSRIEWIEILQNYDITYSPVLDMEQIFNSDYFESIPTLNYWLDGREIKTIGMPFIYKGEPTSQNTIPPAHIGEQTVEILKEINFADEEIKELSDKGIIKIREEVIE